MDATFACAKLSRPDIQKHQQISTKPFYSTRNPTRNPTVQPTNQPTKNMDFGCSHWRIRPELLFAGNFSELGGCWSRTAAKQKLQRLKSQDVLVAVGFMVQKKTTVVYIPTWSFCKKRSSWKLNCSVNNHGAISVVSPFNTIPHLPFAAASLALVKGQTGRLERWLSSRKKCKIILPETNMTLEDPHFQ